MNLFRSRAKSRVMPAATLDLRQEGAKVGRTRPPGAPRVVSVRTLLTILVVILVVVAVGGGYYWLHRPAAVGEAGMRKAVQAVGQLMILPTDEKPTYGTVADKAKLKGQTFFAKAENGDEVLIYEKARLSILFRPSVNKIVNVGPLITGSMGSPYVTSRMAIKNGTGDPSYTAAMTAKVKRLYPNAAIVSTEQASRTYPATIAIDLSKKNQPLDEQIADSLGIQAGKVPLGEPTPEADFLIIIGQDYK